MTTDLAFAGIVGRSLAAQAKAEGDDHFDQGSQFTSKLRLSVLGKHKLDASMSRRGNRHDNAVAESFFQLLKREQIRWWADPAVARIV